MLDRRVKVQAQSPLFDLPFDVFRLVVDEWKKLSVSERVAVSLVCKKLAAEVAVRRNHIPRAVDKNAASAPKHSRLNFMLRLAPWFDDDAARNSYSIQAIEQARAEHRFEKMDKLVVVDEGWIFCVSCLKYRQARVTMLDLNHSYTNPSIPGRWSRCIIRREDETRLGRRLCFDGVEGSWTSIPADKSKLPDYSNPKSKIKKAKKVIKAPKDEGKAKPKEKTDAPQTTSAGVAKGRDTAIAAEAKALEDPTGLEDCHYLPVDMYGERLSEFSLCPMHAIDPIRLIGM